MAGDPWRRDEGKVSDSRRPMAGAGGPLRLREWLVAQIESGRYAGLRWEDAGKTLFRIPWKHAAKQGYQAWAIYKGKYLEGIDKEDPSTWKTRLRCALNKSADFCEVPERSQLDISNPYKVYRLLSDGAHDPVTRACAPGKEEGILQSQQKPPGGVTEPACRTEEQDGSGLVTEDKDKEQPSRLAQQNFLLPSPLADHSYQAQNPVHPWSPLPSEDFSNPDCWLHVRLFYRAELVREATALAAEGCSLSPRAATAAAERLLGPPPRVAQVRFPEPPASAHVLRRLLPHLERGVLLWVAPEGVFAKRLCQGRVYWRGPLAPHRAQPNKLERERTCQLLDTRRFLAELRAHLQDGCPEPEYQIRLCFGEEYPGPPDQPEERLIMAHVSHFPLHRRTTPHPAPLNSLSLLPPVPALPLTCHMTSDLEDLLCENARGNGLSLPAPQQSGWVRRRLAHSSTSLPPRRWSQSSPGSSSCTRRSTARCPGGRFPA
ncbi:interferon regulatory factor 4 isoform X1 [Bos taurus]|uniref:interferon regulatory factor 4 isoform X1 n=1 Tax=Bos taurus TaxID=9913 RepID=UPI0028CBADB8|nr:interferon regulatory factor 4 isoform X1 [Bos taurus]